jgi:hypothetical protein
MKNYQKHMFFKSLKARSRGKTLEIIIAKRMSKISRMRKSLHFWIKYQILKNMKNIITTFGGKLPKRRFLTAPASKNPQNKKIIYFK